ncbi:MAG: hypothetical protein L6R36_001764 [Xanthoria steineri]|nr:MAG: hypothetical protein L6R36_001764 [Xanthoria steineri]
MSKRTVFTTITPLPAGITRETVIETLHNHFEMIDLNPLVIERHLTKAPRKASPEEFHSIWYHVVDKINYFPGYSGRTEFDVCFHNLNNGLQTHVYAPLGLDIKDKWSLGGSLPHEPKEPVEIGFGVPKEGLWLREDVDMRCNIMATGFVKKTLKKAHGTLVERLVEKAHIRETKLHNMRLEEHNSNSILSYYSDPRSPGLASPLLSPDVSQARPNANEAPNPVKGPWNLDHRGSLSQAPYPYSPPMEGMQQALVDPRYSQPSPQSKYSQPPPDPRYALPPEDARNSQSPVQGHDPRMLHQAYTPVELPSSAASSQPQWAELGSF